MNENIYTHDHFNTWQTCKKRYYFKYIKKLNLPDFTGDYELGKNMHALLDYYLRGHKINHLLQNASEEVKNSWNSIKDHPLLALKNIKTEWGFISRIGDTENWLIGRIDAIFYNSETRKYIIADWKTGKYIPKNVDSNFQHKIYLYAFYNCQKDMNLEFSQDELEFQYIKILDEISVNTIKFCSEKEAEYERIFLKLIKNISEFEYEPNNEKCPLKECVYRNSCFIL
ncbi:MAG TPA: PD-(D/E)XK nuclease family protein [Candidatus Gastranaerophilales bacterium]|nr:PD-(D/E)XK nuclease family protein [Candidatus Gastranaerophilales bacterium]